MCMPCIENCKTCLIDNLNYCEECLPLKFLNLAKDQCDDNCPDGETKHSSDNICVKC